MHRRSVCLTLIRYLRGGLQGNRSCLSRERACEGRGRGRASGASIHWGSGRCNRFRGETRWYCDGVPVRVLLLHSIHLFVDNQKEPRILCFELLSV